MLKKIVYILILVLSLPLIGGETANKYPVIFVHGIFAGFEKWKSQGEAIADGNYFEMKVNENNIINDNFKPKGNGRQIWNISYYSTDIVDEGIKGDLDKYSDRVAIMIEQIKKYSGEKKVILVAHSMGGLVTRNYMSMSKERYDGVYKILTVATPNTGVDIAPPIIGQFKDLNSRSIFIDKLNNRWEGFEGTNKKWGVVGAVDKGNIFNRDINENSTDSAGPGYVKISGAIPFGEWKKGVENIGKVFINGEYFAYMTAVYGTHNEVLKDEAVTNAIQWAIK